MSSPPIERRSAVLVIVLSIFYVAQGFSWKFNNDCIAWLTQWATSLCCEEKINTFGYLHIPNYPTFVHMYTRVCRNCRKTLQFSEGTYRRLAYHRLMFPELSLRRIYLRSLPAPDKKNWKISLMDVGIVVITKPVEKDVPRNGRLCIVEWNGCGRGVKWLGASSFLLEPIQNGDIKMKISKKIWRRMNSLNPHFQLLCRKYLRNTFFCLTTIISLRNCTLYCV